MGDVAGLLGSCLWFSCKDTRDIYSISLAGLFAGAASELAHLTLPNFPAIASPHVALSALPPALLPFSPHPLPKAMALRSNLMAQKSIACFGDMDFFICVLGEHVETRILCVARAVLKLTL